MTAARILVVEDNADLAGGIEYNLKLEGYDVRIADDGHSAISAAAEWNPDLVLLDLMLPGVDGYHVLQAMRVAGNHAPVIILSARGEESDKVRGFRLDADQYVTKPFGILELLERVAALLRRGARETEAVGESTLGFGDVAVDRASRTVLRAGTQVPLTPKAYELLLALVRRDGAVASRVELLKEVWGYSAFIMTRTVDSHIAELRRKLDDPDRPRHIITVWKVGYRLER
jgi:DNA-binding response OmpR family regulator